MPFYSPKYFVPQITVLENHFDLEKSGKIPGKIQIKKCENLAFSNPQHEHPNGHEGDEGCLWQ